MNIVKIQNKITQKEAVQLTEKNLLDVMAWCDDCEPCQDDNDEGLIIPTLEGNHLARWGAWVIKGLNGEFYPCKPDIFEKSYEIIS